MDDIPKKYKENKLSLPEALNKIRRWCAYQERSHFETRNKLVEYGLNTVDTEGVIADLISENFLNEGRFAESFARGKFRIKNWGKNKIKNELRFRKISDYSIKKAITAIDNEEYYIVLKKLVLKKQKEIKEKNDLKKRFKIINYLVSRGFERDLVNDVLNLNLEE